MKKKSKNIVFEPIIKGNLIEAINILYKKARSETEKNILNSIENDVKIIENELNLGNIDIKIYLAKKRTIANKIINMGSKIKNAIVFISYNHKDTAIANKIKKTLIDNNINVIIDRDDMKAGDDIFDFIIESIKKSDITLSIVSNNSLLSGWVGVETVNTFFAQKFNNKKFIACYLDTDFFDNEYQLKAIDSIDKKIKELDELIKGCKKRKIDSVGLNKEKTRLYNLRNSFGEILQRLKDSLCIDISDENFDENIQKVVKTINGG